MILLREVVDFFVRWKLWFKKISIAERGEIELQPELVVWLRSLGGR